MKELKLTFVQVAQPSKSLTKFGGQPNWLGLPEWPMSPGNGEPMTFLGQVELVSSIFGEMDGKVAYIFMNTDERFADSTWDPAEGETAVIVQPGINGAKTEELILGPAVEHNRFSSFDKSGLAEFEVADRSLNETTLDQFISCKIGGSPQWIQGEEFPFPNARLVLQMADDAAPIGVNFGTGAAYVFVDSSGQKGAMLWQC